MYVKVIIIIMRRVKMKYVYFTLVEFPERDEFFWTIITASPSYARKHFDEFDDIIDSFELEEADSGSAGSSSENGSAI